MSNVAQCTQNHWHEYLIVHKLITVVVGRNFDPVWMFRSANNNSFTEVQSSLYLLIIVCTHFDWSEHYTINVDITGKTIATIHWHFCYFLLQTLCCKPAVNCSNFSLTTVTDASLSLPVSCLFQSAASSVQHRPVSRRRFSPSPADSVLSRRQPMHIR